ncbi:MAG: ISL3 family transposase, partial [Candidatus Coprovivens sp.]
MYNNDYILNLLNIKDKNISILPNIEERVINKTKYKIISAILTYIPKYCSCCGVANNSSDDIIKWGFRKNCIVKIPKVSNCKTRLILHKQRFYCKHCNNTFIAETNLIDRNKNISNNTELQIVEELMYKQSEKDIASKLDISVSKIDRKLNDISSHTVLRHSTLPKSMNWDEFKATKDTKGK